MNKLILICLLFVIPTAFAASCSANTLVEEVGLEVLDNTVNSATLGFCKGLQGEDICCSVDTINSIQTTIDTLTAQVIVQAAARDTYLLGMQSALTAAKSTFKTLQDNAIAASAAVTTATSGASESEATGYAAFQTAVAPLKTISTNVVDYLEEAADEWDKYQAARADCANTLLETQASVYCLACRNAPEDLATFNLGGQLSYTDDAEEAMSKVCAPYLYYAQTQNAGTFTYSLIEGLSDLNTLLASITADATKATTDSATTIGTALDPTAPTADYQEVPEITDCDTVNSCEDAYMELLNNGLKLVPAYLANGGMIEVASSSRRALAGARTLVAGPYDPTATDNTAGVTVDFPADVIAAASAWRQGGLMTCVVALVAMLLF